MRLRRMVLAAVSAVLATPTLQAATLQSIQGGVLVNAGGGYKPVTTTVELKPGDSILVNPGGSAVVTFPDGCSLSVAPGTVTTIGANSPCVTGATEPASPGTPQEGGFSTNTLLIGAGVTAVVVGGIVLLNKKSASP